MENETNAVDQGEQLSQNSNGQTEGGESKTEGGEKNGTASFEKLVQAKADKLTAEISKKNAHLQKELDTLKREKMTAEELKQLEMSEKEKTLAEREKMLLDKENRLIAIRAIKEAGLDDGSDKSLELVDFVMAADEDSIKNKVKAFGNLVNKFVESKVGKIFKDNGRNPNNSNGGSEDEKKSNSVAENLGKARAEKQKQSDGILKFYRGGK